jgi:hypothetical protein
MKSKETDILMICKGHYNKDKHTSVYDALKAYQCEYTGSEEKYMPDSSIFNFILDTAEKFFRPIDWKWLITENFVHDMDMARTGLLKNIYPESEIKLSYKYLIDSIRSRLCMLPVRDFNNEWTIDLSDYDDCKIII